MDYIKIGERDGSLILSDDCGNSAVFDFLEMAVVDGIEYAALLQLDDESVVLLRFNENNNGHEVYSTIDDDNIFEKVAEIFEMMFDED